MNDEDEAPAEVAAPGGGTPPWKSCCLWPAIGLAAIFAIGALFGALTSDGDGGGPSAEMASYHCRDMVREKLKDPSSAEFSDETITGTDPYEIEGTVRGNNSFGGATVNTYSCTVTYDPRDDGYMVKMRIY